MWRQSTTIISQSEWLIRELKKEVAPPFLAISCLNPISLVFMVILWVHTEPLKANSTSLVLVNNSCKGGQRQQKLQRWAAPPAPNSEATN